jgi:hypothetical protein
VTPRSVDRSPSRRRAWGAARWLAPLLVLGALACDATSPRGPSGPGEVAARLVSPNGAEGAAVLELSGSGIGAVRASAGTTLFIAAEGATTRLVLVRETPGELAFHVHLADRATAPTARVIEVAGGDDQLRTSLTGYRVEF